MKSSRVPIGLGRSSLTAFLLVLCHAQFLWFLKENRNDVSVSKAHDGIHFPLILWALLLRAHTAVFREKTRSSEVSCGLTQWFLIGRTRRRSLDSFKGFIIAILVESYVKKPQYLLEATAEVLIFMSPLQNTITVRELWWESIHEFTVLKGWSSL